MANKQVLDDAAMNNISGGATCCVNTGMAGVDAVVRGGPGTTYAQIASLKSGTQVNTTGNTSVNGFDGRTWHEINYPVYGWMAGSLLGLGQ